MRKRSLVFLVAVGAISTALRISAETTLFPGRLAGAWVGKGKPFGADTTVEMRWCPALGGKFVILRYRTERPGQNGAVQVFEGHAVYQNVSGKALRGWWFDSRGVAMPIDATFDGRLLSAQWGSPETETGRTTYEAGQDEIVVIDTVRTKDGAWKEFARATLRRDEANVCSP